jgi:23S rRNA (pseudouridine1915-N3)-methyltransferase
LQIELVVVGKIKSAWNKAGAEHYQKLLSKFADVKISTVREGDSFALAPAQVLAIEAERIRKVLLPRAFVLLLDVAGKSYDSERFAGLISHAKMSNSSMQFVIGGPFGISPELKLELKRHLSLSPMTFPHELTAVILLEQIYRACSIEAGTKYHK